MIELLSYELTRTFSTHHQDEKNQLMTTNVWLWQVTETHQQPQHFTDYRSEAVKPLLRIQSIDLFILVRVW